MSQPRGPREAVVIGYGNTLRGDDGIGPHLAEEVAAWGWPHVRALAVHQLTPELAETLSAAGLVVFVDASADPEGEPVRLERVGPGGAEGAESHCGDPRALLGLARDLYGSAPEAWRVAVRGWRFELGELLSAEAAAHCRTALERIAALLWG
jgi:hydrogenase maturation protease